jgi:glycosyltransferase involved in cell wall biosynthesis
MATRQFHAPGVNGLMFDFFDPAGLARQVVEVLAHPARYRALGERARQTVVERYDMQRVCLPAQVGLVLAAP